MKRSVSGFTIVELLIVIVVIAILATISVVAYNGIQHRAAVSRSISDLKTIQKSLEMYYAKNGAYPSTGGSWVNSNDNPTNYVPDLVPGTVAALPAPQYTGTGQSPAYMYRSTGTDYKIMAHGGNYGTLCPQVKAQYPGMVPNRDCWAYGYYSPGGQLF